MGLRGFVMSVRFILCALALVAVTAAPSLFAQAQTAAPAAAADQGVIGTIQEVEGTGTITPQGGALVAAAVNGPVHLNDVIETGPQSKVFVLLIDNTQFTLSENAKLTVNEYVYDPDNTAGNKGRYSVLGGAFQYVSGLLTKKPDPDVQIETPSGSIGIRGTDLTGGEVDGEYGVHVDEGAVDVITDKGKVRVNQGEGTTWKGRGFAPGRPHKWAKAKLQRFHQRVMLKHPEVVRQRVAAMQQRHQQMRQQYRQYMQTHPRGQQQQQQRQERRGEIQQQRQEQRQGRMEQRPNNRQENNQLGWRQQQRQGQGQAQGQRAAQGQAAQKGGGGLFGGALQQMLQGKAGAKGAGLGNRQEQRQERQNERRKRWQEKKDEQQNPPSQ